MIARASVALLLVLAAGCSYGGGETSAESPPPPTVPAPETRPESPPPSPLLVSPSSYDFAQNPRLLARILKSPHGYFRFINRQFAQAVCVRFRSSLPSMPAVNLHGDAHVEQYAVTERAHGLTDFDDSSAGPAVLDLIRFAVSLALTCDARGYGDRYEELLGVFLRGYRAALDDPDAEAPVPGTVSRIRAGFPPDRAGFLGEVDGLMSPLPGGDEALRGALALYVENMHAQDPRLPRDFFQIVRIGSHGVGVGSALDEKYLVRVRGRSPRPDDDVVLEMKEVRDLSGVECLDGSRRAEPFRIMVGQSRISYQPFRFLGYTRYQEKTFWVHAWEDNYAEVDIETIASADELRELVYAAGVQLGRGHPRQIAAPLDLQLRRALRLMVDEQAEVISSTAIAMTAETRQAWQTFRAQVRYRESPE